MNNKEQLIKELELFLAKLKENDKPEIDFSILNNEDVFYLEANNNYKCLFVGKDPFERNVNGYNIIYGYLFHNTLCEKNDVIELRKATDKEIALYRKHYPKRKATDKGIALYRKHYPKKQKIWIEVIKFNNGSIGTTTSFTEKQYQENLQSTLDLKATTLEVIEREY